MSSFYDCQIYWGSHLCPAHLSYRTFNRAAGRLIAILADEIGYRIPSSTAIGFHKLSSIKSSYLNYRNRRALLLINHIIIKDFEARNAYNNQNSLKYIGLTLLSCIHYKMLATCCEPLSNSLTRLSILHLSQWRRGTSGN